MNNSAADPERLEREWLADQDVILSLQQNGDVPTAVRPVDVSFRGDRAALERLAEHLDRFNLAPLQIVELDTGEFRLDSETHQTTEEAAIRALTVKALEIEATFGVAYDGWGCVAVGGSPQ